MLEIVVGSLFSLVFPRAPGWIARLISSALPAVIDLVEELDDAKDRPGPERFAFVVEETKEMLDASLDDVPEWGELKERQRDRILGGLVELCLFIHRVSHRKRGRKDIRKALRKIRRSG
tara:strand:- start:460 stop:816 length:357 start_codon:yes stop_codon:yes gene_type:complete